MVKVPPPAVEEDTRGAGIKQTVDVEAAVVGTDSRALPMGRAEAAVVVMEAAVVVMEEEEGRF